MGSGPLVEFSKLSLIILTVHPIFFSNSGTIFFAAPPPTSIVISGLFLTSPDGSQFRLVVENDGSLVASKLA